MKRFIYPFIVLFGFFGCQNVKEPEKPKNLIAKDKMVNILTEAYLANAARSVDNRKILDKGIKMDAILYKKFGVDSLLFAKSNAYYAADVDIYLEIAQQVEVRLDNMQKEMDSIIQVKREKKDSLNIIN